MTTTMSALALCLALTTAGPQEGAVQEVFAGYPVLAMEELELVQYVPEHQSASGLMIVLAGAFQRELIVRERGENAPPVSSIVKLGDTLVLYDAPEQNRRVLAALAKLDLPDAEVQPDEFVTRRYTLRYLAPDLAKRALAPLQDHDAGFTVLDDRGAVSLMGTPTGVARMEALLAEFDVPADQFRIQVLLVRGVPDLNPDPGRVTDLPEELHRSLVAMLPRFHFTSIGTALLQTSATAGRDVELSISSAEDSTEFDFRFQPVAYNATSGDLSVEKCELRARRPVTARVQAPGGGIEEQRTGSKSQQIFSTSTILGGGEYTVIGGAGAEPVFAVVRVTPVR